MNCGVVCECDYKGMDTSNVVLYVKMICTLGVIGKCHEGQWIKCPLQCSKVQSSLVPRFYSHIRKKHPCQTESRIKRKDSHVFRTLHPLLKSALHLKSIPKKMGIASSFHYRSPAHSEVEKCNNVPLGSARFRKATDRWGKRGSHLARPDQPFCPAGSSPEKK